MGSAVDNCSYPARTSVAVNLFFTRRSEIASDYDIEPCGPTLADRANSGALPASRSLDSIQW
jgi:hypothetical protein